MTDPRTILTVAIVAILIWHYLGFWAVVWCAVAGVFIALFALVYIILRGEGKIKIITNWFKNAWKYYLKIETKFFKWIDSL